MNEWISVTLTLFLTLCKWNEYLNDNRLKLCLHILMPKNHSTITCKKGAQILPTFSCIEFLKYPDFKCLKNRGLG